MAVHPAQIVVIGGNSSVARHLLSLLPSARAIARSGDAARVELVGEYEAVRPAHLAGAEVVINCAGIVTGTESELMGVNVDLQTRLAVAARDAAVARYIAMSSFSIFGPCRRIDDENAVDPHDAYGRSKRDGDEALRQLQTDRFATVSVAFPAIVGTARTGKVERMLQLWRRLGVWPIPSGDVARSMIGALGAARVLAAATADDRTGRVLAADPVAFSYRLAARWLQEDVGGSFKPLPVPGAGLSLLRRIDPGLYRSMMVDSLLAPWSNYAVERGVASSLRRELAVAAVRKGHR